MIPDDIKCLKTSRCFLCKLCFSALPYRMMRMTSHTIPISSSTMANAVESPNTTAPITREMINPSTLRTAPNSFPQIESTRPTHLKISTRKMIANKIDIVSVSPLENISSYRIIITFFLNVNILRNKPCFYFLSDT